MNYLLLVAAANIRSVVLAAFGITALMVLVIAAVAPQATSAAGGVRVDESDIARVTQWSLAHAANDFGGAWLGPDGSVRAGFTRDIDRYDHALAAIVLRPASLRVVLVARSWNSLLATQAAIDRDRGTLNILGVDVTATGIIPDQNKVSVSVRSLGANALQILTDRYGSEGLLVKQRDYFHTADRRNVGPPWVGGMSLLGTCGTSDCVLAGCTANFTVYDFIQGAPFHYLATAGHCFGNLTQVTNGALVPVGTVVQRFWLSGSDADVEIITEDPGTASPNIITHDPTQQPPLGYEATQNLNEAVCKSGVTTDETCGWTISAVHAGHVQARGV